MKKRVAIWLHGGIGTGQFSQGQPVIEMTLQKLSADFDLVIYSHRAPNNGHRSAFSIRTAPAFMQMNILRWIWLMVYFLRDHISSRFDSLFSFWGYPAGFLVVLMGKLCRRKTCVYLLGADSAAVVSIKYGILLNPFHRRLALWTYHHCDHLLALTRFQRDQLKQFGFDRSINIIPQGIDKSMFSFKSKKPGDELNIIHVGHLSPVKDQETLLQAFSLIVKSHPAKLKIIGGDDRHGDIQQLAIDLGIREMVEFLGVVPYEEMPKYYEWANVMMHTSLSEGQCVAAAEGAACGVLLAGTKVGLLYDLEDTHAIRIEIGDYRLLAEKILTIINDPVTMNQKIQNARIWSEQHDLLWTVNKLKKILA